MGGGEGESPLFFFFLLCVRCVSCTFVLPCLLSTPPFFSPPPPCLLNRFMNPSRVHHSTSGLFSADIIPTYAVTSGKPSARSGPTANGPARTRFPRCTVASENEQSASSIWRGFVYQRALCRACSVVICILVCVPLPLFRLGKRSKAQCARARRIGNMAWGVFWWFGLVVHLHTRQAWYSSESRHMNLMSALFEFLFLEASVLSGIVSG